jgi:tRNA threonylcarbamoyladenosine biosynthesis protein TsaE
MKTDEIVYTLDTIDAIADELATLLALCSVMTFSGPLGAGKTTLIQALLRGCGVEDDIQSPTFTYLNEYASRYGQLFYHFDLYRLSNKQDFLEAGFQEYLYQPQSWALIEWPEIISSLLKHRVCNVIIDHHGLDRRKLRYTMIE